MNRRPRTWLPAFLLPVAVLLSAALLGACASGGRAPEPAAPLRIVTFNLFHDRSEWPKRLPLIVEGLRALDADVIALQEVLQTPELPNQAETLAAALGYRVQFVSTDPEGQPRRYGNALLTRDPVQAAQWSPLAPLDDSRSIGHARVAVHGRPVNVYFTHLHWTRDGGAIRARQLQDALDYIDRTAGTAPSVLLGDFNAPATAPELALLAPRFVDSYGLLHAAADAAGATTLNPHFFDYRARIDLVFAEAGRFDVGEARIVLDRPDADGTWPSDHFGTFVELRPRD
ncbi:endonuclease/exonuclease/phosphatase family protein [Luteimonas sp. BDR2-5]|uniref:endonuclease/exonuclease/phosphatase family protein n=1 Tax=Proluteimonas luteida TaxID=2878685 RepID=UPI001E2A6404|nr:endonuclease/exonuclease/phosphatase family protein [Luteimonas sp. BDR2-5]MCD9029628.1 endonuclease/exonuclease/phosphatase family protein [Luteimonas sp. BDR2-5]